MDINPGDAYEIPPGHDAWITGDVRFTAVEFAAARTFGVFEEDETERILTTLLFTDIVDSTPLVERLGDVAWKKLLLEHNARMRVLIDRFRGREIITTGDIARKPSRACADPDACISFCDNPISPRAS